MNQRRVTIKDIAREVHLTPSSVSRALNDHPRISPETKAKVLHIARKLNYSPNLFARGLVKNKTNLIGLLAYDFRNPFYAELTRSLQDTAQELGYWVIQASTDDDREKADALIDSMVRTGVEGIIFASCKLQDKAVESLIKDDFPVVLVNRKLNQDLGDYVVLDNAYGAYLIVNHLINQDHRRIALISGPRSVSTSADRTLGYLKALKDRGLKIDQSIIKYGAFSQETGFKYTKRLMSLLNPPRAIFCGDDAIALGAMKALGTLGLRVPEEVSVVGFDDAEISSHPLIKLTTVSQNLKKMGRLAAKTLIDRIEGRQKKPQRILLEPQLIIRRSCGYKLTNGST
jgi:DNA-binding LacI/PurR family transcriptional regulator